jgi:DNA modification methylase
MEESVFKVADTRTENIFKDNSADLAVTSPPYPNALTIIICITSIVCFG